MIDNTIVLFGSEASTTHNPTNLPTHVAGGTKMGLKHGTYWHQDSARMSDLYLSFLVAMQLPEKSFADSSGVLSGSIFG